MGPGPPGPPPAEVAGLGAGVLDTVETLLTLDGALPIVGAGAEPTGDGAAAAVSNGAKTDRGTPTLTAVTAAAAPPTAATPAAGMAANAGTTANWITFWTIGQKIIKVWKAAQAMALARAGENPGICVRKEVMPLTNGNGETASHWDSGPLTPAAAERCRVNLRREGDPDGGGHRRRPSSKDTDISSVNLAGWRCLCPVVGLQQGLVPADFSRSLHAD